VKNQSAERMAINIESEKVRRNIAAPFSDYMNSSILYNFYPAYLA